MKALEPTAISRLGMLWSGGCAVIVAVNTWALRWWYAPFVVAQVAGFVFFVCLWAANKGGEVTE